MKYLCVQPIMANIQTYGHNIFYSRLLKLRLGGWLPLHLPEIQSLIFAQLSSKQLFVTGIRMFSEYTDFKVMESSFP